MLELKCLVKEQVMKHMTVSSVRVWGWVQVRSHEVHLSPCTKDIYSFIQTFFPQQEIQEVVGVGHAHFSLHLRPTKGGVDVAWASPLFCPPQLRKPTPHVSVTEERRQEEKKKTGDEERETEEGANWDSSGRHETDGVSKYTEDISTRKRVCAIVTQLWMLLLTCDLLGNNN